MAEKREFLSEANKWLQAFYRMPAELQVLACVAIWAHMAIVLRIIDLRAGLPSVWEAWIGMLVLLIGLLGGPLVALVTALVTAILLSPAGMFADTAGTWADCAIRISLLLVAALTGGLCKHLMIWLNAALYQARHHVEGTDLPNLRATLAHLDELISDGEVAGDDLDVLKVKVRNLNEIRSVAGQEKLNRVFSTVAESVRQALGHDAWMGQLSDDELLGVKAAGGRDLADVERVVREVLDRPVQVDGEAFDLKASTGIYRNARSDEAVTPESLLDAASRAMERVDSSIPAARVHNAFQAKSGDLVSSRMLREAMEQGEISLCYIPRLNSRTGYFSTLEAALCWRHPQRGKLFLDDFRPMLEEKEAVQGMSLWLVRLALQDADAWLEMNRRFRLAVDVSIDGTVSPPVLAFLLDELEKREARPGWLCVEVNERALLQADEKSLEYLGRLQRQGVSVAVTGFGTAGNTIQNIFRFPVDTVKLCMTNVDKAAAYSEERRQLKARIRMIHARGLVTVAYEIGSRDLLRVLRSLGVHELQGPILSRSLDRDEIPWERIR